MLELNCCLAFLFPALPIECETLSVNNWKFERIETRIECRIFTGKTQQTKTQQKQDKQKQPTTHKQTEPKKKPRPVKLRKMM